MSDLTKILGTSQLQQIGFRRIFDPVRGLQTETVFEGTFDAVLAAEASLNGFGVYHEADFTDPPKARFTLRTPDGGDGTKPPGGILSTTWDLDGNATGKSVFEHPLFLALGTDTLNLIRQEVENKTTDAKSVILPLGGYAALLRDMLIKGQDSFLVGQFVFKVTYVIATDTDVQIAYNATSTVYTNAALISETSASALYRTAIQSAYDTVLQDHYGNIVPDGHTLGWLKNPPAINNIAGNRSAVVIQYWLDAWRIIYPVTSA